MKKALLLTGLLLVLAVPAMAQSGINIAWGPECWGMATAPSNLMTFACGSNTSPANWRITGSFVLNADLDVAVISSTIIFLVHKSRRSEFFSWASQKETINALVKFSPLDSGPLHWIFSGTLLSSKVTVNLISDVFIF